MRAPTGRDRLLELDDVERRTKPFARRYRALRAIGLDALVGTAGRVGTVTREHRPLLSASRAPGGGCPAAGVDPAEPGRR